jgi:hypothetical protein
VNGSNERFGCTETREAVHAALDAELMDAGLKQRLEAHLEGCASCREFASELRVIQGGLRTLPELELPDAVLEHVWNRTIRAHRTRPWYFAAAAAAIAVTVLGGFWLRNGTESPELSDTQLRRAALEARLVLGITSQALPRTERAAVDDGLTGGVSQALRQMPIQWSRDGSQSGSATSKGNGS